MSHFIKRELETYVLGSEYSLIYKASSNYIYLYWPS